MPEGVDRKLGHEEEKCEGSMGKVSLILSCCPFHEPPLEQRNAFYYFLITAAQISTISTLIQAAQSQWPRVTKAECKESRGHFSQTRLSY